MLGYEWIVSYKFIQDGFSYFGILIFRKSGFRTLCIRSGIEPSLVVPMCVVVLFCQAVPLFLLHARRLCNVSDMFSYPSTFNPKGNQSHNLHNQRQKQKTVITKPPKFGVCTIHMACQSLHRYIGNNIILHILYVLQLLKLRILNAYIKFCL
jgi:hypothetical protein